MYEDASARDSAQLSSASSHQIQAPEYRNRSRSSQQSRGFENAAQEIYRRKQRANHAPHADEFEKDAQARSLREPLLNKYKYLRTDMERLAAAKGLRFVAEFGLEQLRKWRSA